MGCPKATRREGVKMGREWSPGPILLILDLVTWKKGFGAKACVVWRENQAEELEILHTDNSFQKFYYKDQQRFYKWHVFTVKTWMTLRTQSRKKIPCYPTIWKKKKITIYIWYGSFWIFPMLPPVWNWDEAVRFGHYPIHFSNTPSTLYYVIEQSLTAFDAFFFCISFVWETSSVVLSCGGTTVYL